MSFSSDERRRLADLLLAKGPDAPTLCEGWLTRDLAAHLWIREHRLDAAVGMFVPAVEGHLESTTARVKERPYSQLVGDWAGGPGKFNPVCSIDRWLNLAEHFVHHEDVRRGQWMVDGSVTEPRDLTEEENAALTRAVVPIAKLFLRHSEHPIQIRIPGRVTLDLHPKSADQGSVITVAGAPGEVLLWLFGRDAVHVAITPEGAPDPRSAKP
ncbi:TIGR03085 family metal-binding protein [Trueperella pyogenes]